MRLNLLLMLLVLLAGCQQPKSASTEPYIIIAVPAPTADRPNAYNYLPGMVKHHMMNGEEYLFLSALNDMPLEESRPLLDQLGYIQDHEMSHSGNTTFDMGDMRAQFSRRHLLQTFQFPTSAGERHVLLFLGGFAGGAPSDTRPVLAVLADDAYRPIMSRRISIPATPAATATAESPEHDALVVLHTARSVLMHTHTLTLRTRFTATSIEQVGWSI